MNLINQHLDKNNLHHAYLIEGANDKIVPEILEYIENLGIKTFGNPDFYNISIDFLKIKQALDLRSMGTEKGFSSGKKIFIICINRFSPDAQGVLLKMFEEPIENTHFFIIIPDINVLVKTLISRCYLIKTKTTTPEGVGVPTESFGKAEKFIAMSLKDRIDFIKEFVSVSEKEEDNDVEIDGNFVRSEALKFLNTLEYILHKKLFTDRALDSIWIESKALSVFEQIFKVREFLHQQGSLTKRLLESVALIVPNF